MNASHGATQGAPRRRAIERLLVEHGLVAGPRRLRAAAGSGDHGVSSAVFAERLQRALVAIGPLFAAFGMYLSRRPDVLPTADCLALAAASPPHEPLPAAVLEARLRTTLAVPLEEAFASFDATPHSLDAMVESHAASLPDQRRVLVRVARIDDAALDDLDHLRLLKAAFGDRSTARFDEAVADFRDWLPRQRDLGAQAAALEALSRDAVDSDLLVVAPVHHHLSGRDVLTVDRLTGVELAAVDAGADGLGEAARQDLARRLHLMFLQQALVAGSYPVNAELTLMADGRLGLSSGVFEQLPDAAKSNLWSYLHATAGHRPDQACEHLLRELDKDRRDAAEAHLHLRLRQVVPFRDGAWTERGDTVAEHLVLHWQLSREAGFRPRKHVSAFYQGLFWAAQVGNRLAPRADPLRDAVEDMRWLAGWIQFRQMTDPRALGESLENNFANLLELPQKLDQVLSMATGNQPGFRVQVREPAAGRRTRNRTTATIALSLMMATLVLLSTQLEVLGVSGPWVERVSAVLFLLLGAVLLAALGRRT